MENNLDIVENYCKIPLRNKKQEIVEYAIVDIEDFENVNKFRWSCFIINQKTNNNKYYRIKKTTKNISINLSHFICGKPKNGYVIDHIDNNSLNHRRCNLRECTISQNAQNRKKMSNETKSKYIGVCKDERSKKYRTRCAEINLGSYDKEIDAAIIYDKFALVKYGINAQTNNLVKYEEIINLTLDDIIPTKEKLGENLPKYISFTENNTYYVRITYNKHYFGCRKQTLDEAIEKLKEYENEVEKIKTKENKEHYNKEITRNSKGEAIIFMYNKKKEIIGNTIVDDDKWHDLSLYGWCLFNNYARAVINGKKIFLHRYLLNANEGDIVDHINSIRYDNRLDNLRITNHSNNGQNKNKLITETSSSKYKGVHFAKNVNKYNACISKNNIDYNLGYFDDEVKAGLAYNLKAIELFGENANINKLDISEELYEQYKNDIIKKWNEPKKYNGVHKFLNEYKGKIKNKGKILNLGTYDSIIKCAIAYNMKLVELEASFTRLNIIDYELYEDCKNEIIENLNINETLYNEYINKITIYQSNLSTYKF
jgi:hypothetical protein